MLGFDNLQRRKNAAILLVLQALNITEAISAHTALEQETKQLEAIAEAIVGTPQPRPATIDPEPIAPVDNRPAVPADDGTDGVVPLAAEVTNAIQDQPEPAASDPGQRRRRA